MYGATLASSWRGAACLLLSPYLHDLEMAPRLRGRPPPLLIPAEKAKSSAVLLKDEEAPGGEKLRVDGSIS